MSRRARIALLGSATVLVVLIFSLALVIDRLESRSCTAAGCRNAVTFDLATLAPEVRGNVASATICANGTCTPTSIDPQWMGLSTGLTQRAVHDASVILKNAAGNEIVHLVLNGDHEATERRDINGPGCPPPACWHLNLKAVDGALQPETDEEVQARTTGTR